MDTSSGFEYLTQFWPLLVIGVVVFFFFRMATRSSKPGKRNEGNSGRDSIGAVHYNGADRHYGGDSGGGGGGD
jgi:hypothetical protein